MYFSRPRPLLKEALNDFKIETGVRRTQLDTSFLHKRRVEKVIACPKVGALGDLAKTKPMAGPETTNSSQAHEISNPMQQTPVNGHLKTPATTRVSEIEVKLLGAAQAHSVLNCYPHTLSINAHPPRA